MEQERLRRDLAWCLQSAPLIVRRTGPDIWPDAAWFQRLDPSVDASLPAPPHPHHFRLGQYFEKLLAIWLNGSDEYELLAANLQVQDGKRTVGEFDFLVNCGGRVEHWEAAVKFYLGTGDGRAMHLWYGPNTADRLHIKYERLVSRQLRLAHDPHARRVLKARGIEVAASRCFMKGRLFHPFPQFMASDISAPPDIYPHHAKGWWLAEDDLPETFAGTGARFVYLPKSRWLAPLSTDDFSSPLSVWELMEFLASPAAEQATHVAIVTEFGEESRGFIIKNQWIERLT